MVAIVLAVSFAFAVPTHHVAARAATLRWGYYITYDSTSLTSLQAHIGQLDVVSPYFYDLKADGTIQDNSQASALAIMRAANVAIVPMIKNIPQWDDFHKTIATAAQRDAIVQRLVDLVQSDNYAGIHIDFEGVNASDQALLTDFMQRLSTKLHQLGKLCTQAVVARTSDASSKWGGAYDYAALGSLNDYVAIMAYDDHYPGGSPGAIAPISWVQSVVDYAKTKMPATTILLGMPLYGYDWDVTAGGNAGALRYDQTAALLAKPGTKSGFDAVDQSPWLEYTDAQNHSHEAWYENSQSIHYKLNLMLDEGLGGFALWRLGQEDPQVWSEIAMIATPATRIPAFQSTPDRTYFSETGHSLALGFKAFWEKSGGLPVFGYPLTEEFTEANPDTGQKFTVQYFERERFEYHPENAGTPYNVLLGRLGVSDAQTRGLLGTAPFTPLPAGTTSTANCDYFPQTGHRLCFGFKSYWHAHGLDFGDPGISFRESLALFGYPISEEFTDPATGVTVQYFERARFEYHPENKGTPYVVELGLLGNTTLQARGWIR